MVELDRSRNDLVLGAIVGALLVLMITLLHGCEAEAPVCHSCSYGYDCLEE